MGHLSGPPGNVLDVILAGELGRCRHETERSGALAAPRLLSRAY
jgi:hypothetical protein